MYIKVGATADTHGRSSSSSDMFGKIVLALSGLAFVSAQIPNLGWCPEYVPMANFDMKKFMGVWFEAERYFQLSEVVSRCVMTNYTRGLDGRYRVSNQVTNRFTGIKRILEGEIKPAASKAEEGKLQVKYTTIPLTPETKYSVLETDYNSYAVLWSCQGIGPVHAQNAWVMTRDRIPQGETLQKAYGVLDKYRISRTFFVKTDQADCAYFDLTEENEAKEAIKPKSEEIEEPIVAFKSAIVPQNADKVSKEELADDIPLEKAALLSDIPKIINEELAKSVPEVESVPQHILKAAETVKEENVNAKDDALVGEVNQESVVKSAIEKKSEHPKDVEKIVL